MSTMEKGTREGAAFGRSGRTALWKRLSDAAAMVILCCCVAAGYGFSAPQVDQVKKTNRCEECDLSGADLANGVMNDARLTGARLAGAKATGVDLSSANLSGADLSHAELSKGDLVGANFSRAKAFRKNNYRLMLKILDIPRDMCLLMNRGPEISCSQPRERVAGRSLCGPARGQQRD